MKTFLKSCCYVATLLLSVVSVSAQYAGFHVINNTENTVHWKLYTATTAAQNPGTDTLVNQLSLAGMNRLDVWHASAYEGKYSYVVCSNSATGQYDIPAFPVASLYTETNNVGGYTYQQFYVRGNPTNCTEGWQSVTLHNDSGQTAFGVWEIDGVEVARETMSPGQYYNHGFLLEFCPSHSEVLTAYMLKKLFEFDLTDADNNPATPPTIVPKETNVKTPPSAGADTNTPTLGGGAAGAFNPTNIVWRDYTNIIDFSGTSSTAAKDDTLKAGFGRVSDQLREIKESIDLGTAATLQGSGISSGSITGDMSGVISAVNSFHVDNTNLLTGIYNSLNQTNFGMGTSATNGGDAMSLAEGLTDSISDSADSALSGLGTAPAILSGGSAAGLSMEFMGRTLNFDPAEIYPGAGDFMRAGLMLVVALWLGRYLVDLYLKTATVYATSQTGGVPAIGPWGAIGLPLAIVVAAAIVALWVAVFALLFSNGLDYIGTIGATAGGVILGDGGALYLLNHFFPIAFILSACWTRLIAPFAVTKLIIITASAQRFLLGK